MEDRQINENNIDIKINNIDDKPNAQQNNDTNKKCCKFCSCCKCIGCCNYGYCCKNLCDLLYDLIFCYNFHCSYCKCDSCCDGDCDSGDFDIGD